MARRYNLWKRRKNMDERIENNFRYHAPTGDQPEKYEKLRSKGKELAYLMQECGNPGRELSLAMTKLEEAVMWANASIARDASILTKTSICTKKLEIGDGHETW
jgi:hypothetical protein